MKAMCLTSIEFAGLAVMKRYEKTFWPSRKWKINVQNASVKVKHQDSIDLCEQCLYRVPREKRYAEESHVLRKLSDFERKPGIYTKLLISEDIENAFLDTG